MKKEDIKVGAIFKCKNSTFYIYDIDRLERPNYFNIDTVVLTSTNEKVGSKHKFHYEPFVDSYWEFNIGLIK